MALSLIGMVHLGPLPGSPGYQNNFEDVLESAGRDAAVLTKTGFDAIMIENFGDSPFFADEVPKMTVAAMARAVTEIRSHTGLPLGVNILRNDALAALAVAATCGASFIRVNVLSGTMHTDQGTITGRAADLARQRAAVAPQVEVFADVFVKHATPPAGTSITQAAADTFRRGGADALILSGSATGAPADLEQFEQVRASVPEARILAGSGVSIETIASILEHADGAIVGTSIKVGGITIAPVDPAKAAEFIKAAQGT